MRLIFYSKPGCHLCEGLLEKLQQIKDLQFDLEVRDITTQAEWFLAYQYEIPVLFLVKQSESSEQSTSEQPSDTTPQVKLPRLSPRASVAQVEQMLSQFMATDQD